MIPQNAIVRAAVVQAAPVLFDREATVDKACGLIAEAARRGAQLILFPEAFIPAYPRGLTFGTVVGSRSPAGRLAWERYWANAVTIPSPATDALAAAARQAGAYLAIGVVERDSQFSGGTLTKTMYPADLPGIEELASQPEVMCRGGSAIISPLGEVLAGPLYD
ncbi:MAG: hypothetical protein N2204_01080, partial [Anaerolineae bacterium]|nr:hypothetical protein [Anaerolineae bacterium]